MLCRSLEDNVENSAEDGGLVFNGLTVIVIILVLMGLLVHFRKMTVGVGHFHGLVKVGTIRDRNLVIPAIFVRMASMMV